MSILNYIFSFAFLLSSFFSYSQDGISLSQQLEPIADLQADGHFAESIEIDGDYMVVGSPYSTINYSREGAVFVYKFETAWNLIATLTSPNPSESGFFGFDVDISGEVIVIGAYKENFTSTSSSYGNVYVFEKPNDGWSDSNSGVKLLTSKEDVKSFGKSVAVDGTHIAVSIIRYGEVYVYKNDGGNWTEKVEMAILKQSDPTNVDNTVDGFGYCLGFKGDIIVAGSPYHDLNSNEEGAAYLFEMPISGWVDMTETAKLTSISSDNNNHFGFSVSIGEDYVVVGAKREDGGGWGIGAAYIYEMPINGWESSTESAKLTASDGDLEFNVGVAVQANGDYVYVGANYKFKSGAVYVFSKTAGNWENSTEIQKITYPSDSDKSYFGYSIATRANQLLLGDSENGGSIEIYETTDGSWTDLEHISQLTQAFETSSWDRFGEAVAIEGNIAVIGAPNDDFANNNAGIAYVFELLNGNWQNIARLSVSDGKRSDFFGRSVDIKENLIIVGAPNAYDLINDVNFAGAVYAFVKPANGWDDMVETQKIGYQATEQNKYFGNSIAIASDYIVVGQNQEGCLGCNGKVLLFEKNENNEISLDGKLLLEGDEVGFKVKAAGDVIVCSKQRGRNGTVTIIEKNPSGSWDSPIITNIFNGSGSFGYNIDINGASIAVSSPVVYNDNGIKAGVYVFTRKSELWSELNMDTVIYQNPDPDKYYLFGGDVALSSKHLLISADFGSSLDKDSSQVWRVRKEGEFWSNEDSIMKLNNSNMDYIEGHFNNPLAIDGNIAVVGSYMADVQIEDNSGIVYVYDFTAPQITFDFKNYDAGNKFWLTMHLSEQVTNLNDLGLSTFNSMNCNLLKLNIENELEVSLQLEVTEKGLFSLDFPSSIFFDAEGNPNSIGTYSSSYKLVMSVDEIIEENLSYYPNPVKDNLSIDFKIKLKREISITDILGNLKFKTTTLGRSKQLNFQQFSNGIYFVSIKSSDRTYIIKVINSSH